MKFNEDFVRQEALHMLQNALEGCGGSDASLAYIEAFRLIMRLAVGDKSFTVRVAAVRCLKAFANVGGPGLGVAELDNSASYYVKALEDPVSSVRDAFAKALGAVLALGMNPEAQVQARGKGQFTPKKLEGGLQRHLVLPFMKGCAICALGMNPEAQVQARGRGQFTPKKLEGGLQRHLVLPFTKACVLYILRVGVTDQMTTYSKELSGFLSNQLQSSDASPPMKVAALRTSSYGLKTLEEVPLEFKEVLGNAVVAALSHSSPLVQVEAAFTLCALAEVDPTCVGGLISYEGSNLKIELD